MQQGPFKVKFEQLHARMRPRAGTNFLTRIVSWMIFALVLGIGLIVGLFVILLGWILLLPMLWRRRQAVKQAWRFAQANQQAQRERGERDRATETEPSRGGSTIEGEYVVKDDERTRR